MDGAVVKVVDALALDLVQASKIKGQRVANFENVSELLKSRHKKFICYS